MSIPVKQRTLLRQGRSPRVYSVSFRDSGPSPRGVRRDAAVGMVAEVAVGGGSVRNDFDKLSVFQRPICNATWDKEARAWRDFVWQGEQGFSFSPTQPYREVLYQCRPFWYRIDYSGEFAPSFVSVAEEHVSTRFSYPRSMHSTPEMVVTPWAARAAITRHAPARRSVALTSAP